MFELLTSGERRAYIKEATYTFWLKYGTILTIFLIITLLLIAIILPVALVAMKNIEIRDLRELLRVVSERPIVPTTTTITTTQTTQTTPPPKLIEQILDDPKTFELLLTATGSSNSITKKHVSVVDLSGSSRGCEKAPDFPIATQLASGARYLGHPVICGGLVYGQATDECYIFYGGEWNNFAKLQTPRFRATSVNIDEERFWITGGYDSGNKVLSSTEVYDHQREKFVSGPVLPDKMSDHCLNKVNDTHFALVGGWYLDDFHGNISFHRNDAFYLYDSSEKKWKQMPDLAEARDEHFCGVVTHPENGLELVAAGGLENVNGTTEIYTFKTNKWRAGNNLPLGTHLVKTVPFKDTFIGVGGLQLVRGLIHGGIVKYNITNDSWDEMMEHLVNQDVNSVSMMISEKTSPCNETGFG